MIDENGQVLRREGLDETVEADVGRDAGRAFRAREQLGQDDLAFPAGGRRERLGMERQGLEPRREGRFETVRPAVDLDIEGLGPGGGVLEIVDRRLEIGA